MHSSKKQIDEKKLYCSVIIAIPKCAIKVTITFRRGRKSQRIGKKKIKSIIATHTNNPNTKREKFTYGEITLYKISPINPNYARNKRAYKTYFR